MEIFLGIEVFQVLEQQFQIIIFQKFYYLVVVIVFDVFLEFDQVLEVGVLELRQEVDGVGIFVWSVQFIFGVVQVQINYEFV